MRGPWCEGLRLPGTKRSNFALRVVSHFETSSGKECGPHARQKRTMSHFPFAVRIFEGARTAKAHVVICSHGTANKYGAWSKMTSRQQHERHREKSPGLLTWAFIICDTAGQTKFRCKIVTRNVRQMNRGKWSGRMTKQDDVLPSSCNEIPICHDPQA